MKKLFTSVLLSAFISAVISFQPSAMARVKITRDQTDSTKTSKKGKDIKRKTKKSSTQTK